jgi:hypothetical protein
MDEEMTRKCLRQVEHIVVALINGAETLFSVKNVIVFAKKVYH